MKSNLSKTTPLGPVMIDLVGQEITPEDQKRLLHPLTGGVILFSRNYQSIEQLIELVGKIRSLRTPPLLVAVDHEGGRVQRFRESFTRLPAMRKIGELWSADPQKAKKLAEQTGFILASELRACHVDFSFAPVLDIDYSQSKVIGDRAFHREPKAISDLAFALMKGMKQAGMANVGKHFPGHGYVEADSHVAVPKDMRSLAEIEATDLVPFRHLIKNGLNAVMPAHVIYPAVDPNPAGFSKFWMEKILRKKLRFDGVIFSDDLSMEGACVAGNIVARGVAALEAGCDMVLVCNNPAAADELLAGLKWKISPVSLSRLARMYGKPEPTSFAKLHKLRKYMTNAHDVTAFTQSSSSEAFSLT
jgi:beta-N-acetylhexosaminidase